MEICARASMDTYVLECDFNSILTGAEVLKCPEPIFCLICVGKTWLVITFSLAFIRAIAASTDIVRGETSRSLSKEIGHTILSLTQNKIETENQNIYIIV